MPMNKHRKAGQVPNPGQKVRVFGSYVTGAPDLGDIDLFLELGPKDPENRDALDRARSEEAQAEGRRFRHFIEFLCWPETEVERFLRNGSPYPRFHPRSDPYAAAATTILFPRKPPPPCATPAYPFRALL